MGMSVQHAKASAEWYTPAPIVEASRQALGGVIDLDPATCELAQERVRALTFGTLERPATLEEWAAARTVFMNPPTPPRAWWEELSAWFGSGGDGRGAVYIAYSLEQLQQSHGWTFGGMLVHRVLIPAKRIPYDQTRDAAKAKIDAAIARFDLEALQAESLDARRVLALRKKRAEIASGPALVPGDAPPHAGAIVMLGNVNPRPLLALLGGTIAGPRS